MTARFVKFGAGFADNPKLDGKGGIFQRLSIVTGLGLMSVWSLRTTVSMQLQ